MNLKALLEILYKTILDSFTGQIWKWILGSFGTLMTVLLFGKNVLSTTLDNSIKIGIVFLICIFVIRFILFLVRNSFQYLNRIYRDSKYGDAIILLKDGFAKANSYRKSEPKTDEDLIKTMVYLCDNIQKAFNGKNSCRCSVSIKVPVKGSLTEQTSVVNLCRDSENSKLRDNPNYKAIDHTIIGNTPFRKVLNNVLRNNPDGFYYLNNDISNSKDYDNTSKEVYTNGVLPYNSEIVVPIIPTERDNSKIYETLGFLCVDCVNKNKFDPKYDVALIEIVADGIYDILSLSKKSI
ncbi:MAG: hypothetical protein RBT65_14560 [Methanolobus sp.]|nr:hypothetical protein [Methanolobus sp.]